MDPATWQRVRELFLAALERDAAERAAFLDGACGGDGGVRREVERLIAAHERAGSFLEGPTRPDAAFVEEDDEPLPAGRRLGAYRVVRQLGRGGMGAVYLAERADEEYRKQVAVKLIKRGMDSEAVLRHFRGERQILASLEHPNIARLLDGGTTEEGLPYLVMEYIEGEPIDRYCDARQLSITERLELFRQVGAAVSYAHQRLVVHRDIKPSNVLVGPDGVPKLLDFGIAKILDPELSGDAMAPTATVSGLMTPAYASPEQVEGRPATTLTDVYSLGVVLYELLTGRRPYVLRSGSLAEAALAVCTVEPERPSAAISRPPRADGDGREPTAEAVSRPREGSPERLRRRLSGDLDNICLVALRKDPARRYRSVEHLCDDIRRHLAGLPVSARQETLGYRLGKFVKRHRAAVGAAAAFLALAVAFVANTVVQSARVARERDRAERVAAFLTDLFKVSDPSEARGNTVTAREVLDKGAASVARGLEDQPEVRAALLDTMGGVYANLGLYRTAKPLLEQAIALRRGVLGAEHPDVGRSLNALGKVTYGMGDYPGSERLFRQSLAIAERDGTRDSEAVAGVLNNLGNALGEQGKYEEGIAAHREALAIRRRLYGNEHPRVAESLDSLALLLRWSGETAQAAPLYRQSLAMRRKLLGNDHPDVARNLDRLASALFARGDDAGAERYYRESLALKRRLFGDEHPETALCLHNLAGVVQTRGDLATAEELYREALARQRRLLGNEHPDVALTLSNLASLLSEAGKDAEAETAGREALALRRKLFGPDHPNVAFTMTNVARSLRRLGRLAEAESMLREAARIARKAYPKGDDTVASALLSLADVLTLEGRGREGEPLAREGLAMRLGIYPAESVDVAGARSVLGGCLTAVGRFDEAEPLLLAGHSVLAKTYGAAHAETRESVERLVALYTAQQKAPEARRYQALLGTR
jgi:serine/threonine-protein kinase